MLAANDDQSIKATLATFWGGHYQCHADARCSLSCCESMTRYNFEQRLLIKNVHAYHSVIVLRYKFNSGIVQVKQL